MFSNVTYAPTVYKTGIKTLPWRVQQKGSYLRNYYVTPLKTKAIDAKCESQRKATSYWRPLGFSIFFTNQVRIAVEK